MAYCTADEVNEILGGSLSPEAEDAALGVVDGVSSFIDLYTGQHYGGGAIAGEIQTVLGGQVTLSQAPVAAMTSVTVTDPYIGAVPVVLDAGVGYQLLNPQRGLVLVSACDGAIASLDYTAAASAVPAHINLAAKILAAHCIRYAIDPTGFTLSQLQAGTATLTYVGGGGSGAGPGAGLPALFEALLGGSGSGSGSGQNWVFA